MSVNQFQRVTPRLPVTDLSRTITFYRERLGFEIDVLWPDAAPTFALLRRDDASLGFFMGTEHQPGTIGYAELYIQVADASGLHAAIRNRVPIEWGPEVYAY